MLNVLLIVAAVYFLYTWGVRLQVRAQLFGSMSLDLLGYACSMLAGTAASLYATITLMDILTLDAYLAEICMASTAVSILCGEFLHARSCRLCFKLLAPLRSEEQER